MAGYLSTDPQYAEILGDKVWLWQEWPGRNGQPDKGIDLVAQDQHTGEVWAIQCKFSDPEHTLQKGDLDSFFTASGKKPFARRMVGSTTDKWGKHAEEALRNQSIPTVRLRVQDLDDSPVEWSGFTMRRLDNLGLKTQHRRCPHQREAIANVLEGFKQEVRGKLLQMRKGLPEQFLHHVAVAMFVRMGKRVAARRHNASDRCQLRGTVSQRVTDIIEPDGMGELSEKKGHHVAPRREGPRLLVYPVFAGGFFRLMRRDKFTKLMQCAAVVLDRRNFLLPADSLVGTE